ncbi:AAA family ATPase [Brevibacterium jeotgali]|uniref:Predicted ATPase n=1 Tax=Brevibacterium jeotgali TaxID=1262550 RepID=A0A2H1L5C1_9MICO|nr:AAA family ATPase [Brevibacterium jeotgali]TWB98480.1 putative ATPase [Brevibacterium jeotgali]SMY12069.1 Predicted ATPase [Brevibacterium jeotgali]
MGFHDDPDARTDADAFSTLPVRRVEEHRLAPLDRETWPATLAPVRQVLDHGWELSPITVLVGDNGAGKSTLVEALAIAFGLNPEGGTHAATHETRPTESELHDHLQIVRGAGASKRGVFLRAETMHGHFSYLESIGPSGLHSRSHGEAFLDYVTERSRISGLWVLDEPESALSFSGCLALIGFLRDLRNAGSQVVLSTHSPVLAALPGAQIYEVGEWGLRHCDYDDLELIRHQRSFLEAPERYLRHLE